MSDQQFDETLEDALDGLNAAARYCEPAGLDKLSQEAASLYQRVGEAAPDEDWGDGDDIYTGRELVVSLERPVTIPGRNHRPPQTTVFRARERVERDETTKFFGLNIGSEGTVVEVARDNIRAIACVVVDGPGGESA